MAPRTLAQRNLTIQTAGSDADMSRNKRGRPSAGFTAVELIVTMGVLAILVAIAVPSMQSLIRRNNVASEANRVVASLQQARTLAISGGPIAGLCVSGLITPCQGGLPQQYGGGFMVVTAPSATVPPFNPVLITYNEPISNARIFMRSNVAAGDRVLFNRLGRLAEDAVIAVGVIFTVCWDNESTVGVPGIRISVNPSGRVQSERIPVGACEQVSTAGTS